MERLGISVKSKCIVYNRHHVPPCICSMPTNNYENEYTKLL